MILKRFPSNCTLNFLPSLCFSLNGNDQFGARQSQHRITILTMLHTLWNVLPPLPFSSLFQFPKHHAPRSQCEQARMGIRFVSFKKNLEKLYLTLHCIRNQNVCRSSRPSSCWSVGSILCCETKLKIGKTRQGNEDKGEAVQKKV